MKVDDLKKARKKRKDDERKQEREYQKQLEMDRARWEKEASNRVDAIFDNELKELILKLDEKGHKTVRLDEYRSWVPGKHWPWDDTYLGSPLKFNPRPDYSPTKKLIRKLRRGGFSAKSVTEQAKNVEYVTTADGYDIVDAPGYHDEHFVEISWK